MYPVITLILSLFISFNSYAADRRSSAGIEELGISSPEEIERLKKLTEVQREKGSPKYSQFKRMSSLEVYNALEEFTGRDDFWKNNLSLLSRIKKFNPFQRKTTIEEERLDLSYTYAKKSNTSLQEYVLKAYNSKHPEIKGMIAVVQGDKRIVLNSYKQTPNYDLKALLLFFQTIEYGDTDLETKKFHEFSLAFSYLASTVQRAYQRAAELNMPLIIEFESSALMPQSPLTRLFFNALIRDTSQVLKAEVTPDRGRVIAIHPFYAKQVVENLNLFTDQFRLKVNTLRNRIFSDPDAKQRLLELIKYGQGSSGLLYTDERIQELAVQAKTEAKPKSCKNLFSLFSSRKDL